MTADLDSLARRAARGDDESFAVLCRLLNDEVWRYCRALTNDRELAFEAAQETFVRLVPAIRRFRGDSPVRPFVFTIARRATHAVLTAQRRAPRPPVTEEPADRSDHTVTTDTLLLIGDLPAELRDAFVLTQLIGLGYDQAAAVCDCPVGTIRSRVYRARRHLIEALEGAGTASDGPDFGNARQEHEHG